MALMDEIRKTMIARASRGIGTGGGLMGNQSGQPGLLGGMANINPNLLLGANIIGAGLQGRDPFSSLLPAVTQTAQTSAVLGQLDRQRKSKEFIDKYKKDLPEGSTLKTLFEINPDKALDFISKQELAKLNAQGQRTTAVKNAIAIGLNPGTKEFNDFIKGQTIKTDAFAQSLQAQNQIAGSKSRDEIIQDTETVKSIYGKMDDVMQKIEDDPSLAGGLGAARRAGNKIGTFLKDLNIDVEPFLPKGMGKEFIFDKDIATITALENSIAPAYARVLFPNQRLTNQLVFEAKRVMNITGLTGSQEVTDRFNEIKKQMEDYISVNEGLLGRGTSNEVPRYEFIDGKLKRIK